MGDKNSDILNELKTLVKTKDDKKILACSEAFKLAEKHQVETSVIGRICNKENIKLYKCQFGCF